MDININGTTLYYEKAGKGFPLIILHGNGEDHHIFDMINDKLKKNFCVYAIDSRNHGQSSMTNDYRYETMANDIYEFIQTLHLDNVNIIGFSDGAIISLILSLNHHEVINKMALLGINLKPEDFIEDNYRFILEKFKETHDPLLKLMLEEPQIELEDVKDLYVPTLLIAGEYDLFKQDTFVKLKETLPLAKLKIMKDHDHSSYIVNQAILYNDFIEFFQ